MKKSIVLGLTATLLTFGPLVAGNQQPKASKPASSQAMQKQQPSMSNQTMQKQGTASQSTTKPASSKTAMTNRIHKLRGTVDSVSADKLSITTKSGAKDTFVLQTSTKSGTQAKAGDRVTVWYRDSSGEKTATRIAVNHSTTAAASKSSSGKTTSAANTKAKTQHSAVTAHH